MEQSQREEMNAAIRAQRERHAAPRTIAPEPAPPPRSPAPQAEERPERPRTLFRRLRGK